MKCRNTHPHCIASLHQNAMHRNLICGVIKFCLVSNVVVLLVVVMMLLPLCVSYDGVSGMPAMLVITLFFSATCR